VIKSDIDMNSIYPIPVLVNHEIRDKSYDKKITGPVNYDKIGNKHNVPNVSETRAFFKCSRKGHQCSRKGHCVQTRFVVSS
jgi:hypothetical protein